MQSLTTRLSESRTKGLRSERSVDIVVATPRAGSAYCSPPRWTTPSILWVLQIDPPRDSKDYLHRSGRTARAGSDGVVVSIVLPHQRRTMKRIMDQAGVDNYQLEVDPASEELAELTGARVPEAEPIAEEDYLRVIAPKPQQRRRPQRREGRASSVALVAFRPSWPVQVILCLTRLRASLYRRTQPQWQVRGARASRRAGKCSPGIPRRNWNRAASRRVLSSRKPVAHLGSQRCIPRSVGRRHDEDANESRCRRVGWRVDDRRFFLTCLR